MAKIRVHFKQVDACYYDVKLGTLDDVNNKDIAAANAITKWRREHAWPEIESVEELKDE